MPLSNRWTLTRYLIEERRRFPTAGGELNALVLDVSLACKAIARIVAFGELADGMGALPAGGSVNVQGEAQKPLDVLSKAVCMPAVFSPSLCSSFHSTILQASTIVAIAADVAAWG